MNTTTAFPSGSQAKRSYLFISSPVIYIDDVVSRPSNYFIHRRNDLLVRPNVAVSPLCFAT